ncbi:MAG: FKBP-type peptidyl-prolyl cis-trans isomerase [Candidatus Methanoperedens sp.]|nr:FKBP-type peptidyl-prolyl cis-trans isomerase [Candidatus Methanoperedens sp.]MCE8424157.1 FKBP-type peptidyl-prolyl cis-trans isomerase [Candidatus Methanoperedens sp.]MCE8427019.1 FKBP-type peptidyl-prolyl cis-trans isomerase [Candidatus Methanoperedens sp.]
MKKILIVLMAALIFFSGCTGQKTVKTGDNISVDYIGSIQNGKVFDTSIEKIAKENNISKPEFKPLQFTVGNGSVIKGFDEGVIGMKVGETKTLIISPENGYGPYNPDLVKAFPIIQEVPVRFPRMIEVPEEEFNTTFSGVHKKGDVVNIPGTSVSMTIKDISKNVTLSYNFQIGDIIPSSGAPWNETVIKVDDKNVTVAYSVKKNETIQLQNRPWTSTVVDINNENLVLRHNAIPDTQMPTMFGMIKVHFNETSILLDQNHELAGKTLVFNVTLKSIK